MIRIENFPIWAAPEEISFAARRVLNTLKFYPVYIPVRSLLEGKRVCKIVMEHEIVRVIRSIEISENYVKLEKIEEGKIDFGCEIQMRLDGKLRPLSSTGVDFTR